MQTLPLDSRGLRWVEIYNTYSNIFPFYILLLIFNSLFVYIICTNMLALKVRIFALCLWFSYITSTARSCYLCALQNKPDPAVLRCAALSRCGCHENTYTYIYIYITFWDHVTWNIIENSKCNMLHLRFYWTWSHWYIIGYDFNSKNDLWGLWRGKPAYRRNKQVMGKLRSWAGLSWCNERLYAAKGHTGL